MKSAICNCIALYDYSPKKCNLKGWFNYMDQWAEEIGIPWESIGITTSKKLILYKNGKKKLEKTNFERITEIEILGGVSEPGTHLNWKVDTNFFLRENGLRQELYLCFPDIQKSFTKDNLSYYLKQLLQFSDFKYGICYQRPYNMGPSLYASGSLGGSKVSEAEENKIGHWQLEYTYSDGIYRTGLLRDVYPFNILVDTHLKEPVGDKTLEAWISSNPKHGTLEKITEHHWLWSIDPQHIPVAQEVLQEAGLLLCYKL
jgi:hypothetical protein